MRYYILSGSNYEATNVAEINLLALTQAFELHSADVNGLRCKNNRTAALVHINIWIRVRAVKSPRGWIYLRYPRGKRKAQNDRFVLGAINISTTFCISRGAQSGEALACSRRPQCSLITRLLGAAPIYAIQILTQLASDNRTRFTFRWDLSSFLRCTAWRCHP